MFGQITPSGLTQSQVCKKQSYNGKIVVDNSLPAGCSNGGVHELFVEEGGRGRVLPHARWTFRTSKGRRAQNACTEEEKELAKPGS